MTTSPITPLFLNVDGLSVRYAESDARDTHALLLNPWPESIYAFEPVWADLSRDTHIVAVDLPGFGMSEGRSELFTPRMTGAFLIRILDALGLDRVHVVGPDVGTSAALFAASYASARFHSVVVGSGATSVPLELGEPLASWVAAPDVSSFEQNGRAIVETIMASTQPASPFPDHVREDYLGSYDGRRFAESMAYVRSYPTELPILSDVLPTIQTPVRIIAGAHDTAIPPSNAEFLRDRLPVCQLDVVDAGHFVWEEVPDTYASLVLDWWRPRP